MRFVFVLMTLGSVGGVVLSIACLYPKSEDRLSLSQVSIPRLSAPEVEDVYPPRTFLTAPGKDLEIIPQIP